jgi:hypothetical protein
MTHPESKDERTTSKRTRSPLSCKLEKNLWAYAAVASAAGVGMLASAPAAEAKIVYTPVNAVVTPNGYTLDLNNDGVADFYLVHGVAVSIGNSERFSYLEVCHFPENNTLYNCVSSSNTPIKDNTVRLLATDEAAALNAGSKIADGERFQLPGVPAALLDRSFYFGTSRTHQGWQGPWANGGKGVKNRYLGFKFKIDGQFHYGWARMTVTTTAHSGYTATLTGYAYETTPNKGIVAGQESGPAEISDNIKGMNSTGPFRPASLGLLGLGVMGLALWRRKEDSRD